MIKKKLLSLSTILILLCFTLSAQEYSVTLIPSELKKDAYGVVRKNSIECELIGNVLKVKQHYVITVFEESGDFLADFTEYYDPDKTIHQAKFNYYDSAGKKIKKKDEKTFNDYSANSGYSLYEDTRVLYHDPSISSYPYTVEYIISSSQKNFLGLPTWVPMPSYHVSVQESTYKLSIPASRKIKYKVLNYDNDFETRTEKDKIVYSIEMKNQPVLEDEPYSPLVRELIPHAIIYPENYAFDSYEGNYSSWLEYGKWINELLKGRDILPNEFVAQLMEMTAELPGKKEKVLKLYDYLQNTTRYVSIQLGIGGHQPFPAQTVYETGYGDCKALSNYMYAMLKSIGIKSHYTVVNSGRNIPDIQTDLTCDQFNHIMLCVPLEEDTILLECTSQITPPGYIGSSSCDRHVLLIDDDGGHLVKTSSYSPEDNLQSRKAIVEIDPETLELESKIHTEYRGQQYETVLGLIHDPYEDQKEYLLEAIDIPQFEIKDFSITEEFEDLDPVGYIDLNLKVKNYLSKSGNRYFLPLNLMNKRSGAPKPEKNRNNDIFLSYSFHDIDSVIYTIPENLEIEFLPSETTLKEVFGEYHFTCAEEDNQIIIKREIKLTKGTYSKDLYPVFVDFMRNILKADRSKALLIEKIIP